MFLGVGKEIFEDLKDIVFVCIGYLDFVRNLFFCYWDLVEYNLF